MKKISQSIDYFDLPPSLQGGKIKSTLVEQKAPPSIQKQEVPATTKQVAPIVSQRANQAVMDMQQALIDLAKTISSHTFASMTPTSYGHNAFNNYLLNNFIQKDLTFTHLETKEPLLQPLRKQVSETPALDIRSLINAISFVGKGSGERGIERKPDGLFGARTATALINALRFASGIINFNKTMGLESKSFTDADLAQFQSLSFSKLGDIVKATQFIKKIEGLYKEFEQNVLENPQFKDLISQEKPLLSIGKNQISKQDFTNAQQHQNAIVENVRLESGGKPEQPRIKHLMSLKNFKEFLAVLGQDTSPANIKKVLENMKQQLSATQTVLQSEPGF